MNSGDCHLADQQFVRDINDLLERDVLRKSDAGGRNTCHELNDLPV